MTDTKNPDAERQAAIDDIFGPTEKGDFTIVDRQIMLAGKIAKHADVIRAALAQSQPESQIYEGLTLKPTGDKPGEYYFCDSFGQRLFKVSSLAAAPKAKPTEQGQVEIEPIEGLDEVLKGYTSGNCPSLILKAARRYSELARGKGGR